MSARPRPRVPALATERISYVHPRTGWCLCARVSRMPPRVRSRPTSGVATHASLPFFIFAQSFGASISHFLVSLSHLTTINSVILVTVNSLSHFNYRAKSFYDFCHPFCYSDLTHSVREFSHFSLL
jgi:hypothetical protein